MSYYDKLVNECVETLKDLGVDKYPEIYDYNWFFDFITDYEDPLENKILNDNGYGIYDSIFSYVIECVSNYVDFTENDYMDLLADLIHDNGFDTFVDRISTEGYDPIDNCPRDYDEFMERLNTDADFKEYIFTTIREVVCRAWPELSVDGYCYSAEFWETVRDRL